jgi:hypothetical protein
VPVVRVAIGRKQWRPTARNVHRLRSGGGWQRPWPFVVPVVIRGGLQCFRHQRPAFLRWWQWPGRRLAVASCGLVVAGRRLALATCGLVVAGRGLVVAGYGRPWLGCGLVVAGRGLAVAGRGRPWLGCGDSGRPIASSSTLPVWCHLGGGARGAGCWLRH